MISLVSTQRHPHVWSARTRTLVAAGGGAVVGVAIAIAGGRWSVDTVAAWDGAALIFLAITWPGVLRMDGAATKANAEIEDNSRVAHETLIVGASLASLAAVALTVVQAANTNGTGRAAIMVAAVANVLLSWTVVHTVFTLRYAHVYYAHGGGIEFHDDKDPDYGDFAYIAFTVGMTYQVSDTDLAGKAIRMVALRHALLSFVFGTSILAVTINVVAGLVR